MQLILASASPRRAALLKQIGLPFKVLVSPLDEEKERWLVSGDVELLALAKAREVAINFSSGLVLGADTIVICDDKILGKPSSRLETEKMLKYLSGKVHKVVTGIAVVRAGDGYYHTAREETEVKFRKLHNNDIACYASTGESLDKAGGYGIQGKGALLVEKINGCYFNVVGLPLVKVFQLLEKFGCSPWQEIMKETEIEQ